VKRIILYIICVVTVVLIVRSQTAPYVISYRSALQDTNNAALKFERNVNTYLWNADLHYRFKDSSFFVDASGNDNSAYIRKPAVSFRDEQKFSILASKNITPDISLIAEGQSFFLSDSHSLGSSSAGIHSGVLGISYLPASFVTLTPSLGIRYEDQHSEKDEGINFRFNALADTLEFGNYRSRFSGHVNHSDMGRRYFKNDGAEMTIATQFATGSSDSLDVHWIRTRNDFFVPADDSIRLKFGVASNIRSRTDQSLGIQNILDYDINEKLSIQFSANIESRVISNKFRYKNLSDVKTIPFNTDVNEFGLNGVLDIYYRSDNILGMIGFGISEQDEKHLLERIAALENFDQEQRVQEESRLNNTALRRTIHTTISSDISSSDEATFSGSASILQYDTPDTNNTDDRDELLINLSLRELHRFNDAFSLVLTGEATLAHIVYLTRFKSANNNWNRIFRLLPEIRYRPSENFHMYNSFEVLANYTVFDFETIIPSIKSYSYRQVAFLDSTSYDISPKVGFDMFVIVRIFERGELRWLDFLERPLQRYEEVTFSPQLRYNFKGEWFFAAGFRSFAQKKFGYKNNERRHENTFLSAGPTVSINIRLSPRSLIEVFGWKEFQRQTGGTIKEFSNMSMNVKYVF
jgi:hypothetical protein